MEFRPQNRNIINQHKAESAYLNSRIEHGNDAYSQMPLILGIYTMKLAVPDNHMIKKRSDDDYELMKQAVELGTHLKDDTTPFRCYKRAIDIFMQTSEKEDSFSFDLMFVDLESKLKKQAYNFLLEESKKIDAAQITRNFFNELEKYREERRILDMGLKSGKITQEIKKIAVYHRDKLALQACELEVPADSFDDFIINAHTAMNNQYGSEPNWDDLDEL